MCALKRRIWLDIFTRAIFSISWIISICMTRSSVFLDILPVISITTCTINQTSFDFILISRRSCYRAGVRYYMRGLDDEGRSANYVETEQIIHLSNGATASFVQVSEIMVVMMMVVQWWWWWYDFDEDGDDMRIMMVMMIMIQWWWQLYDDVDENGDMMIMIMMVMTIWWRWW